MSINTTKSNTYTVRKAIIAISIFSAVLTSVGYYANSKVKSNTSSRNTTKNKVLSAEKTSKSSKKTKSTSKYKGSYIVRGKRYQILADNKGFEQVGLASWYGPGFHGKKTANGEIYNMNSLTGAHKSLPLPTRVKVTNLENNKSIIIKINDRGPYHGNRILDLSKKAAQMLGILHHGTAKIKMVAL